MLNELYHKLEYYTSTYGYKVIDVYDIEKYSVVLLRAIDRKIVLLLTQNNIPLYQIAIERQGSDFSNIEQQNKKLTLIPGLKILKATYMIKKKITEWINRFGPVTIGTYNERKSKIYLSLLSKLGFKYRKCENDISNTDIYEISN
jgi:hypothetical protein